MIPTAAAAAVASLNLALHVIVVVVAGYLSFWICYTLTVILLLCGISPCHVQ